MRMQFWKDLPKKYGHAWVFLYFFLYMAWFTFLEKRTDVEYYAVHMTLDDYIPFCEYFIIPYLIWFAFIAGTVLYFFFFNTRDFYRCCIMLFSGMTFCLIVYTLFPNEQTLRPDFFARDNLFTELVQMIYTADTCTNVCPSIHVLNSLCAFFAIWESEALRKHKALVVFSGILAITICMSTVFLKQHSMVDVICGTALATILYTIVYKINTQILLSGVKMLKNNRAMLLKDKKSEGQNEIG